MNHTRVKTEDSTMHRFEVDRGVVYVRVWATDPPCVEVYERDAALSAVGKSDEEFRESPEAAAARNKFGVRTMLEIFRAVQAAHPEVKVWGLDPVVRQNPTGPRTVEARHGGR